MRLKTLGFTRFGNLIQFVRRLRGLSALAIFVALVGSSQTIRADEDEVGPELEAQLHLKILSYDRALQARVRNRLTIGIVYRAEESQSQSSMVTMLSAFQSRAKKSSVQGLPVAVMPIQFDPKTLAKLVQDNNITALYVTSGLEDQVGTLVAITQQLRVITLTGRRSLFNSGLAVAVVPKDGKPSIAINLRMAKAAGMNLDPGLLRLAEVRK